MRVHCSERSVFSGFSCTNSIWLRPSAQKARRRRHVVVLGVVVILVMDH